MIPILDWSQFETNRPAFLAELSQAVRGSGFFLLRNHTVSPALRARVFDFVDAFFSLPAQDKRALSILKTPHFRGWAAEGDESLDDNSALVDRKESFNIGFDLPPDDPRVQRGEPFRGVNVWPPIRGFRETMLEYFETALTLGVDIHRAFAADLGLEPEHFTPAFKDPLAALRLLHYPTATGAQNEIGAGAHTDYGAITLLMTDGEPGLQVKPRGGGWTEVPHLPDAYVVNIGDCLMRWTNDIYVSTPHRVLPPKRQRRSVAFFVEANPDTIVSALPGTGTPKYPPVRAADYLRSRLDATYAPKEAI
ncbi:2-oxoglutarate and iron-dependent oxygenase domain-containing protein [uncultured Roseobacter sp.]|uniref:isopenicillin N synthase family dioxygenase n=1 Tax=uncultured Roseobacter sp. TaxID=114847 RepID=UPI002608E5C5|nr:2-oxoglutarate and iron-dependent oxygenase domain-containing protein [uncultured Roseobacter sp.]